MSSVVFRLYGAPEAKAMVAGAADRAARPERVLKNLGDAEITRNHHNIEAGKDTDGRPFKKSRRASMFGGQTMFHSAELADSVNYTVKQGELELYSTSRRARVHYDGETITPKNGRYLTIPLRAKGGVFAGVGLDVQANRRGTRARHYKNTFFARRGGKLFMFQKVGGKDSNKVRALYLLVTSSKLPARKWMGIDINRAAAVLGAHITGEKS